ncbi:hypothetical protein AS4_16470 [Acinetobacter guillouiae]|jgi:hypothetical protein|nr:hypothetical protein AS4_16470 [Acinetobacter guillouiae]
MLISSKDETVILMGEVELMFIKTNNDLILVKIKTIYLKGMKI